MKKKLCKKCANILDFENNTESVFAFKIGFDRAENEPSEVWPVCLPTSPPPGQIKTYADALRSGSVCAPVLVPMFILTFFLTFG